MMRRLCLLLLALLVAPLLHATPALLPANEAFRPTVQWVDTQRLVIRFAIEPGYYLYRDRIQVSAPGAKPGELQRPPGETKADPIFGQVQVYHRMAELILPLTAPLSSTSTLSLTSQGCNEQAKVCYPPQTARFQLDPGGRVISLDAPPPAKRGWGNLFGDATPPPLPTGQAGPAGAVSNIGTGGGVLTLAAFFMAGLLMAGTMCMYPLIPIVSSLIVGHAPATRWRAFGLSMIYVQGLAVTYTVAGLVAGALGVQLTLWLQQPWVIGGFAVLMVIFALGMFEVFELRMPAALQTRLSALSNRFPGGKYASVFIMGALSALIVGPCATPALAGALLYIARTGDLLQGGLSLYVMALGVGTPLLAVGWLGGHALPRSGPWMGAVRNVFGVVLLAVALWMAQPILPAWLDMLLIAALLIGSAVFLSALDSLPSNAPAWRRLGKGAGILLLLIGAAYLVGLLAGSRDPLKPLGVLAARTGEVSAPALSFQPISSPEELDRALASAAGRPVLIDFYADWCVSCIEMERDTFRDPKVVARLKDAVLLRADVTANQASHRALLARFQLFGPPALIPVDRSGKVRMDKAVIGYQDAPTFLAGLQTWM